MLKKVVTEEEKKDAEGSYKSAPDLFETTKL